MCPVFAWYERRTTSRRSRAACARSAAKLRVARHARASGRAAAAPSDGMAGNGPRSRANERGDGLADDAQVDQRATPANVFELQASFLRVNQSQVCPVRIWIAASAAMISPSLWNRMDAQSVMPGLTVSTCRSSSENRSTAQRTCGRGPTRLMSPTRTLASCGNSSSLYRRRTRPTRVILRVAFSAVVSGPLAVSDDHAAELEEPKRLARPGPYARPDTGPGRGCRA